jgi:hypothetical protein
MGLFSKSAAKQKSVETLLLPGDWDLWLRGSSFHQSELKSMGLGKQRFLLMSEPGNKTDKQAVAVMGISKSGVVLCGYLPKDEPIKLAMKKVADELAPKGWAPVVDGTVDKHDGQLVATLHLPRHESCEHCLEEWRRQAGRK